MRLGSSPRSRRWCASAPRRASRKEAAQTGPSSPEEYCRLVTKQSGSHFYYPLYLLPREKRTALHAVYAFCRHSDDLVDEIPDPTAAARAFADWRGEVDRMFGGSPRHPITIMLAEVIQRYAIPRRHIEDLLAGMEMDLSPRLYENFEDLSLYCYRVASTVGLICLEIFGYRDPASRSYAVDQGIALQLTNILRDVSADFSRGRIYLPREDLRRFGYGEEDFAQRVYNERFVALMRFEAERARDYFRRAKETLPPADRRSLVVSEVMRTIYERLLGRIEAARFDVFSHRIRVPPLERFCLTLGAARGVLTGAFS